MNTDPVVTNVRVDHNRYTQLKVRAGELGMSLNAYMNWLIQRDITKAQFTFPKKEKKRKSIYDAMWNLAHKKYKYKPMGASEDDKAIYGIEDE